MYHCKKKFIQKCKLSKSEIFSCTVHLHHCFFGVRDWTTVVPIDVHAKTSEENKQADSNEKHDYLTRRLMHNVRHYLCLFYPKRTLKNPRAEL